MATEREFAQALFRIKTDKYPDGVTIKGQIHRGDSLAFHRHGPVWRVDHLPSGRFIASFGSMAQAKAFIREVADMLDWSTVDPIEPPSEFIARRIERAKKKISQSPRS